MLCSSRKTKSSLPSTTCCFGKNCSRREQPLPVSRPSAPARSAPAVLSLSSSRAATSTSKSQSPFSAIRVIRAIRGCNILISRVKIPFFAIMKMPDLEPASSLDFIRARVAEDVQANKNGGRVQTRFPPETNGYLHIGHAKSICLNFGVAAENNGLCNLRFDDTNPSKESVEYEEAIQKDVRWLGFDWDDRLFYASDYLRKLYEYAVQLVKDGKAYVDSLTADEIREHRGTLT